MKNRICIVITAAILGVLFIGYVYTIRAQDTQSFKVIVNRKNPQSSIDRAELAKLFLKKKSKWFGDMERDEIYKLAIKRGLKKRVVRYGKIHSIMMTNLFFAGKLPKFLGFDHGPIELIGNRATIPQGQIFRDAGRDTTFMPSYRMVTDMAEEALHTNHPGGASGRKSSKYYKSDVENYLTGKYKVLKPNR